MPDQYYKYLALVLMLAVVVMGYMLIYQPDTIDTNALSQDLTAFQTDLVSWNTEFAGRIGSPEAQTRLSEILIKFSTALKAY